MTIDKIPITVLANDPHKRINMQVLALITKHGGAEALLIGANHLRSLIDYVGHIEQGKPASEHSFGKCLDQLREDFKVTT